MIVNALSYPAITLCVAAAVLIFMLLVVVPMFQQVYARMGSDLPGITKTIIRFSEMAPTIILCLAASVGVAFISKRLAGDCGKYQQAVSSVILKLPVAGELVKKYQMSRICSLMHLMTSSGVPVLQALKLLSGIMTFYPFRESILHLCKTIEKGGSLADGISGREHLYGKKFAVLIRVGEETGSLESMFRSQADEQRPRTRPDPVYRGHCGFRAHCHVYADVQTRHDNPVKKKTADFLTKFLQYPH